MHSKLIDLFDEIVAFIVAQNYVNLNYFFLFFESFGAMAIVV